MVRARAWLRPGSSSARAASAAGPRVRRMRAGRLARVRAARAVMSVETCPAAWRRPRAPRVMVELPAPGPPTGPATGPAPTGPATGPADAPATSSSSGSSSSRVGSSTGGGGVRGGAVRTAASLASVAARVGSAPVCVRSRSTTVVAPRVRRSSGVKVEVRRSRTASATWRAAATWRRASRRWSGVRVGGVVGGALGGVQGGAAQGEGLGQGPGQGQRRQVGEECVAGVALGGVGAEGAGGQGLPALLGGGHGDDARGGHRQSNGCADPMHRGMIRANRGSPERSSGPWLVVGRTSSVVAGVEGWSGRCQARQDLEEDSGEVVGTR